MSQSPSSQKNASIGTLYLVPTPIGNLEDITLRSIKILEHVDLILAEDTRNTGFLLKHLNIDKKVLAHHQHNEHSSAPEIIKFLALGKNIALVSDAGSPGISDPGFLLVRECIQNNINIIALPGPTAFVPALTISGLSTDKFVFEGFLPVKKGRQTRLTELKEEERTMVFYESPHRILKTIEELMEYFGEYRMASLSREISKMHEETVRGSLKEILSYYEKNTMKGEIVLCVAGAEKKIKKKKNKYEPELSDEFNESEIEEENELDNEEENYND